MIDVNLGISQATKDNGPLERFGKLNFKRNKLNNIKWLWPLFKNNTVVFAQPHEQDNGQIKLY